MQESSSCPAVFIAIGTVLIADRDALVGAALIALGAAFIALLAASIGPGTIVIRFRQIVDWATKAAPTIDEQKASSDT